MEIEISLRLFKKLSKISEQSFELLEQLIKAGGVGSGKDLRPYEELISAGFLKKIPGKGFGVTFKINGMTPLNDSKMVNKVSRLKAGPKVFGSIFSTSFFKIHKTPFPGFVQDDWKLLGKLAREYDPHEFEQMCLFFFEDTLLSRSQPMDFFIRRHSIFRSLKENGVFAKTQKDTDRNAKNGGWEAVSSL